MVENKNLPNETWVSIGQNESTYFNRETLFNCNTVQAIGFREVSDKLKEKKLKIKGIIEKDILERIYKGILASPMIEEQILKKLEIK